MGSAPHTTCAINALARGGGYPELAVRVPLPPSFFHWCLPLLPFDPSFSFPRFCFCFCFCFSCPSASTITPTSNPLAPLPLGSLRCQPALLASPKSRSPRKPPSEVPHALFHCNRVSVHERKWIQPRLTSAVYDFKCFPPPPSSLHVSSHLRKHRFPVWVMPERQSCCIY